MKKLNETPLKYARHPLVYLVEAADDICYQMMDIEDAHKLKILTTQETQDLLLSYFPEERKMHMLKTLKLVSDVNEQIAYLRSCVIGLLIQECTQAFLNNEEKILKGEFEGSLIKHISELPAGAYKHSADSSLKNFARSDDRCRLLTGKSLFTVAHQPGIRPIQYKSARTLRKNTGGIGLYLRHDRRLCT